MRQNCQHFRRNTSISYLLLLKLCALVHSGGFWPRKRHCTQKVKLCKKNLNTVVNCKVLKLMLIVVSKMFFVFTINSLYLPLPYLVYVCMYVCVCVCVYLVMPPLVSSFVLWSYNVCPQTDLRNFISAVSFHLACPCITVQLSHPYYCLL
jgi:hypothetical protein